MLVDGSGLFFRRFPVVTDAIAVTGRVSRPIGHLMALSGLCYLAQGWIIGSSGFSSANQILYSPRNRPDPRVDSLASRSGPPHEDAALPETTSDATTELPANERIYVDPHSGSKRMVL